MPIGLVAVAIGAGVDIYKAKKSADASHEAAQMQVDASHQALMAQQQAYAQQQQIMQPYQQIGQQALGSLGQMLNQRAPAFNPSGGSMGAMFSAPQLAPPQQLPPGVSNTNLIAHPGAGLIPGQMGQAPTPPQNSLGATLHPPTPFRPSAY